MKFQDERDLLIEARKRKFGYKLQGIHESNSKFLSERARPSCKRCHGRGYMGIRPDMSLAPCGCIMNRHGEIRKDIKNPS